MKDHHNHEHSHSQNQSEGGDRSSCSSFNDKSNVRSENQLNDNEMKPYLKKVASALLTPEKGKSCDVETPPTSASIEKLVSEVPKLQVTHRDYSQQRNFDSSNDVQNSRSYMIRGTGGTGLHAHFDCFSGAAGDMMLASCLDASADPAALLRKIKYSMNEGIPELRHEFDISMKRVWKGGMGSIAAIHVYVHSVYGHRPASVPGRKIIDVGQNHDHSHGHSQSELDNNNVGVQNLHHLSHGHGHERSKIGKEYDGHSHQHTHKYGTKDSHDHHHEHGHDHHHKLDNDHHHKLDNAKTSHGHDHDHSNGPLRNLPQICQLLDNSSPQFIPTSVRDLAKETFTELAIAEAFTHGAASPSDVHFHEVGAIDSIVDIVATILALHFLNIKTVSCSRIPVGEGSVWTDHGELPVPAFATMRLLIGMKTCKGPGAKNGTLTGELVTPTAAALLRVLSGVARIEREKQENPQPNFTHRKSMIGRPPNFTPRAIGIGGGTKEFYKHPNIIRLIIGDDVEIEKENLMTYSLGGNTTDGKTKEKSDHEHILKQISKDSFEHLEESFANLEGRTHNTSTTKTARAIEIETNENWRTDKVTLLQANIDDASAEVMSYAIDLLMQNGALDAWLQPIVMKKGRSAHTLNCLCYSQSGSFKKTLAHEVQGKGSPNHLLDIIFRHTSTLGIRIQRDFERAALNRNVIEVQTIYGVSNDKARGGLVDVKIGMLGSEIVSIKAEFDHCRLISEETGVPIKLIADFATKAAQDKLRRSLLKMAFDHV